MFLSNTMLDCFAPSSHLAHAPLKADISF